MDPKREGPPAEAATGGVSAGAPRPDRGAPQRGRSRAGDAMIVLCGVCVFLMGSCAASCSRSCSHALDGGRWFTP